MKKLLFLLCSISVSVINACEMDSCPFSKHKNILYANLTHISVPDRCKPNELDAVDTVIFNGHCTPYSHAIIQQKENKDIYVRQKDYENVRDDAIQWFQNRANQLAKERDTIENDNSKNDYFKTLTLAVKRTEQYTQYLNKITIYRHPCPGAIISTRALLCAQQYLATQQKA